MYPSYDTLRGFGAAYYYHRSMQKTAENAKKSVGYLTKVGVFKGAADAGKYDDDGGTRSTGRAVTSGAIAGGIAGSLAGDKLADKASALLGDRKYGKEYSDAYNKAMQIEFPYIIGKLKDEFGNIIKGKKEFEKYIKRNNLGDIISEPDRILARKAGYEDRLKRKIRPGVLGAGVALGGGLAAAYNHFKNKKSNGDDK